MLRRLVLRSSSLPSPAMLRSRATATLLPLAMGNSHFPIFSRSFLDVHKMTSKEAIEKEKARLSDELSRGYFADISDIHKHGGKIAMASKTLIPVPTAVKFPGLEVNLSDGSSLKLPIISGQSVADTSEKATPSASLLCLSFRASSQIMAESWSTPFLDAFSMHGEVQVYEVSFIDYWFLSLSPVRQLFLKMMKKSNNPQRKILYSFGDHYHFRKNLQIINLLTGYIFLLDKSGRIRWQGFGAATQDELSSLFSCTSLLLDEK